MDYNHKPIGGYFPWEFPIIKKYSLHDNAVFVNSGRHALEYILKQIGTVSRIFIPFYTCDSVYDTVAKLDIHVTFYKINELLEIADDIKLEENEYILYTNYFGIKDEYVKRIMQCFGPQLIVDNSQALFCPPIATHQIYSPRKFLGMPDGGIAVTSEADSEIILPKSYSYDKCAHLLKRIELQPSKGYNDFKEVSKRISSEPLSQMSDISLSILHSIDLNSIKCIRLKNFARLNKSLGAINEFRIPDNNSFACPMIYPFRTNDPGLRKKLISNKIFVATYWPNVLKWCESEKQLEYILANEIIPLPIDQRYDENDMDWIIHNIIGLYS